MNLARFLDESRVDLDLDAAFSGEIDPTIEHLAEHMATLLSQSHDVVNATKLRTDLINREKRAASLLGHGVALPHVRTLQARKPIMAVGISREGLAMPTPDNAPIRLVIGLVGPSYDDRTYLQIYKRLGERLDEPHAVDAIVASEMPGEVIRALSH